MSNLHGFTWRERLADWISGGALTVCIEQAIVAKGEAVSAAQHSEHSKFAKKLLRECAKLSLGLYAIEVATHNGKSGTARMVNRMAREALQ